MAVRLCFLSIFLCLLGCSSNDKKLTNKQAEIHYTYGTEELFNQNYTKAIAHLLKAVELDPKNPQIHNNLAMAYYFKEEKDMCLKHIQEALKLDPKYTDARVNLASLFFEQGKLELAERTYLEALKDLTFEKHARTYYNLALIEIKRNNFSKATKYLQSSLKQSEDYCPSWLEIGKLELKQGKAKDAVKSFHQARMGSCANDPAPLYWQGVALMQAEEYLNARMKFDEFQTKFSNTEYNRLVQQKLTELTLQEAREHSRTKHSQKVLDDTHF